MTKTEQDILDHLAVWPGYADMYFCFVNKHVSYQAMWNRLEKTEAWVKRNGGTFRCMSEGRIVDDRKGFAVQIRFPAYGKRNMKEIMATIKAAD